MDLALDFVQDREQGWANNRRHVFAEQIAHVVRVVDVPPIAYEPARGLLLGR